MLNESKSYDSNEKHAKSQKTQKSQKTLYKLVFSTKSGKRFCDITFESIRYRILQKWSLNGFLSVANFAQQALLTRPSTHLTERRKWVHDLVSCS